MKHRKEKSFKATSAVIRGKKNLYDFKVFPLVGVALQPIPAVYVISHRKIDKKGRGHHKFVCIGQTVSLEHELAKHRKGKCLKKYKANAIYVLPTENEKSRFLIEADLKAAHTIPCQHESAGETREIVALAAPPKTATKPAALKLKAGLKTPANLKTVKPRTETKNEVQKPKTHKTKSVLSNNQNPAKASNKKSADARKTKVGNTVAETARPKAVVPVKALKSKTENKNKVLKPPTAIVKIKSSNAEKSPKAPGRNPVAAKEIAAKKASPTKTKANRPKADLAKVAKPKAGKRKTALPDVSKSKAKARKKVSANILKSKAGAPGKVEASRAKTSKAQPKSVGAKRLTLNAGKKPTANVKIKAAKDKPAIESRRRKTAKAVVGKKTASKIAKKVETLKPKTIKPKSKVAAVKRQSLNSKSKAAQPKVAKPKAASSADRPKAASRKRLAN